ncbi:hypothetical protein [Candidatus Uabimicrobium sp. HlEnr_7]|uniref:hypothetical protein n=1 Tax=Candidatus Uabimicrobium helgolandensis TaxID=3095367 RepID=UPI0035563057
MTISELSTHSNCVKWLDKPEHEKYQECWKLFYERYHQAIVLYILSKASWSYDKIHQAEDIASRVYEKGFRWSFHRKEGVRFRILIKSLVRDVLRDYWRKKKIPMQAIEEDFAYECDTSFENLSWSILEETIHISINKYPEKKRRLLLFIWKNSRWPNSLELAELLQVKSKTSDLKKAAAQQWKKRNRYLWEEFQKNICRQIEKLAYGKQSVEEENKFFQNLR